MLSNSGKPKSACGQGNPEPSPTRRYGYRTVGKVQRPDGSHPNRQRQYCLATEGEGRVQFSRLGYPWLRRKSREDENPLTLTGREGSSPSAPIFKFRQFASKDVRKAQRTDLSRLRTTCLGRQTTPLETPRRHLRARSASTGRCCQRVPTGAGHSHRRGRSCRLPPVSLQPLASSHHILSIRCR